ncbi:hypothetical protein EF384_04430 [Aerococcus agrisoli]|uniref:Uncharacterized protein n=1 Tax=Aerococcus agrisoli TaxID=2487350 RepID=A0A3N4GH07_9LACT|nr:hypothetical protein [Aerococcus agrisoli]RPA60697.1 hypothetical protein EF384_04430 [Aerococcus agrisoli]
MIYLENYTYENDDVVIGAFKETLKPKSTKEKSVICSDYTEKDFDEYSLIIKWLKENDYYILEFPNVIENQTDLKSFGYDMIRSKIKEETGITDRILWSDRRELIDNLTIVRKNDNPVFLFSEDILDMIAHISTNKGDFHTFSLDDQLVNLNNSIEYLLKTNKEFVTIEPNIFYKYFSNEDIKRFRNETQVFRHSSPQAIDERNQWDEQKKKFYVRLGIIMVTNIYHSRLEDLRGKI